MDPSIILSTQERIDKLTSPFDEEPKELLSTHSAYVSKIIYYCLRELIILGGRYGIIQLFIMEKFEKTNNTNDIICSNDLFNLVKEWSGDNNVRESLLSQTCWDFIEENNDFLTGYKANPTKKEFDYVGLIRIGQNIINCIEKELESDNSSYRLDKSDLSLELSSLISTLPNRKVSLFLETLFVCTIRPGMRMTAGEFLISLLKKVINLLTESISDVITILENMSGELPLILTQPINNQNSNDMIQRIESPFDLDFDEPTGSLSSQNFYSQQSPPRTIGLGLDSPNRNGSDRLSTNSSDNSDSYEGAYVIPRIVPGSNCINYFRPNENNLFAYPHIFSNHYRDIERREQTHSGNNSIFILPNIMDSWRPTEQVIGRGIRSTSHMNASSPFHFSEEKNIDIKPNPLCEEIFINIEEYPNTSFNFSIVLDSVIAYGEGATRQIYQYAMNDCIKKYLQINRGYFVDTNDSNFWDSNTNITHFVTFIGLYIFSECTLPYHLEPLLLQKISARSMDYEQQLYFLKYYNPDIYAEVIKPDFDISYTGYDTTEEYIADIFANQKTESKIKLYDLISKEFSKQFGTLDEYDVIALDEIISGSYNMTSKDILKIMSIDDPVYTPMWENFIGSLDENQLKKLLLLAGNTLSLESNYTVSIEDDMKTDIDVTTCCRHIKLNGHLFEKQEYLDGLKMYLDDVDSTIVDNYRFSIREDDETGSSLEEDEIPGLESTRTSFSRYSSEPRTNTLTVQNSAITHPDTGMSTMRLVRTVELVDHSSSDEETPRRRELTMALIVRVPFIAPRPESPEGPKTGLCHHMPSRLMWPDLGHHLLSQLIWPDFNICDITIESDNRIVKSHNQIYVQGTYPRSGLSPNPPISFGYLFYNEKRGYLMFKIRRDDISYIPYPNAMEIFVIQLMAPHLLCYSSVGMNTNLLTRLILPI
jgi:hypothetical protein